MSRVRWGARPGRCGGEVYAEIDNADKTYLLSGGKWYAVSASFVAEVNASVQALENKTVELPNYDDTNEATYNARAAAQNPSYALMDRKNIPYGAARSSIELCDLFSDRKQLIHVKRGASSDVLSHLFSQGAVSAEAFAMAADFRDKCRTRLPASHRSLVPKDRPSYDAYEVVFAVITGSLKGLAEALPFFSRINLRNRAQTLRALGYRVSLTKVPVQASAVVSTARSRIRARPPSATVPTLAGAPMHAPPGSLPHPAGLKGRRAPGKRRPPAPR